MDVTSVQNTATSYTPPPPEEPAQVNSDFETFLNLLTTQLKNQDPLKPVDSSEFAVQLATFSSVEQQVKTNDLLSALGQQLAVTGLSQLAGWVGMEARVAGAGYFSTDPVTVYPEIATTADKAYLLVSDAQGQQVARQQIDLSGAPVQWAGTDTNGQPLPAGLYQFSVESIGNGNILSTQPAEIYALVNEVKTMGSETFVVLQGGAEVLASQITALRAPTG